MNVDREIYAYQDCYSGEKGVMLKNNLPPGSSYRVVATGPRVHNGEFISNGDSIVSLTASDDVSFRNWHICLVVKFLTQPPLLANRNNHAHL